jgi:hypothetical protein
MRKLRVGVMTDLEHSKRFRRRLAIGAVIAAAVILHEHDFAMSIGAGGVVVCLAPDGCTAISLPQIYRAWSLGAGAVPETADDNPTIEI